MVVAEQVLTTAGAPAPLVTSTLPSEPEPHLPTRNRLRIHCLWKRRRLLRDNWDWWTGWTGSPGVGKSTQAMWTCWYQDETFFTHMPDRISYDAETWLRQVDEAKPGTSLLLDEAAEAWYYKKWYDEVIIALDMAAVQIRDKRLDVHLATPSLAFIGKIANSRLRSWGHIDAPGYIRGRMEYYYPSWLKFNSKKYPYWDLQFEHAFKALPPQVYELRYLPYKRKEAKERLERYIDIAAREGGNRPSFREQVDDSMTELGKMNKADLDELRNSRGNLDFGALQYEFNIPADVAREAIRRFEPRKVA